MMGNLCDEIVFLTVCENSQLFTHENIYGFELFWINLESVFVAFSNVESHVVSVGVLTFDCGLLSISEEGKGKAWEKQITWDFSRLQQTFLQSYYENWWRSCCYHLLLRSVFNLFFNVFASVLLESVLKNLSIILHSLACGIGQRLAHRTRIKNNHYNKFYVS